MREVLDCILRAMQHWSCPTERGAALARRFLTIPNALTLVRLGSAPLFLLCWFAFTDDMKSLGPWTHRAFGLWACLALAITSELSDLLDGYLARRWHQVSAFGKLMDPYADSAFRLTAFLCFASHVDVDVNGHAMPWYPLWMPILLVLRDVGTSIVRTFGMERGVVVSAKFWGKAKAVAQGMVIIALLALALARDKYGIQAPEFRRDATIMMAVVLVVGYWGLAEHLWAHLKVIRDSASREGPSDETPE
jgi:CDP-diacylglycerol--glycerol-3-phosphate 3-phosphatidyltransferase